MLIEPVWLIKHVNIIQEKKNLCVRLVYVLGYINKVLFIFKREVSCVLCSQVSLNLTILLLCYLIVFSLYFWDFNIQCRVCYTACSVNRRETVSLFNSL